MNITITESKDIYELPVGTVATVDQKYTSSDWVKTGNSTWASLPPGYDAATVADYVSRRENNISPQHYGPHTILNPEFVLPALLLASRENKQAERMRRAAEGSASARLRDIEAFIAGTHECEADQ